MKSSFAIKVSNVEERYNEVIVKTKEEVQSLEKALEERGQEVNLLRSQVRMDEGDVNQTMYLLTQTCLSSLRSPTQDQRKHSRHKYYATFPTPPAPRHHC